MLNEKIKNIITDYLSKLPVLRVYVFGSYARNEENATSDLDLLLVIDYSKKVSLFDLIGWKLELEEKLKINIDLVSEDGLSKYIKPIIDKEKLLIYEKAA